jgi:hypothetical protein
MKLPFAFAAAVLSVALGSAPSSRQQVVPERSLGRFLATRFGFSAAQIAAVRAGRPIAVNMPSSLDREVAVAGAIHIDATAERLVALLQDVERLESGTGFLRTRRISDPPRLEDFADLELPAADVKALRKCRPGNCDVKLGQGAFDLLKQIDWRAADATAQVNALARRTALEYVEAYRKGGNGELAIYRDSKRPQFIAEEFADMVARTRLLPDMLPELADFLLRYPAVRRPEGTSDFFYWSLADFGLKPVLRLNHVVVYPTGEPIATRYAVAVKQLYASHYFHTALEIRAVVDDAARPGKASYLVMMNMARSDGLTGMFGGLVKSKALSGSREGLEKALGAIRRLSESEKQAPAQAPFVPDSFSILVVGK